jgi:molybdate transport system ATP-binding protein
MGSDMNVHPAPLIKIENASLRRNGQTLLRHINWEIQAGQNWAIVGPNGAGKSLLMQLVLGRWPCYPGQVVYADPALPGGIAHLSLELHQQLIARERDQEVFRQFSHSASGGTTVGEWLADAAQPDPAGRLAGLIQRLGVTRLLAAPLLTLSNGEMRRVLIVRALCTAPRLLILDEPYGGLDVAARRNLAELINPLPAAGTQLLLVTHHLDEIPETVTHALCLIDGQIVLSGRRQEVLESEVVARFFRRDLSPEPVKPAEARPAERAASGETAGLAAASSEAPVILMRNVTVAYGTQVVLDRLNWVVPRGQHWAIVGPNGAGKSTLLRLISADHLQAYANEIYLWGRRRGSGESIWEIKQKLGLLSPESQIAYQGDLLAAEVVLSGFFDSVGLYHQATAAQKAQADDWIGRLGLEDLARQNFSRLAYGHRRLILLARALVKSPELLLLDEPCQGLDPENSRRLIETVSAVAEQTGTQLLYVSHRRQELPACLTHVLELGRPGWRVGRIDEAWR